MNHSPVASRGIHDRASAEAAGLVPIKPGQALNPSGLTKERRELYSAIERRHIPKVEAMLDEIYIKFFETGDAALARLWLEHVRGPIKANKGAEVEAAVERRLQDMLSSARAARSARDAGAIDVPVEAP